MKGLFFVKKNHRSVTNMETIDYLCGEDWKGSQVPPRFKVAYSQVVISFLKELDEKTRKKILFNINKSKYVIDEELFKKLPETDVWEFRTLYGKRHYRIFAFWDTEENTVVTTHGIIKKRQRTPKKEIIKCETIRQQYYAAKQSKND